MKKLIIASATILTLASATSLALKPSPIEADDKPPIVLQVENHEKRIGDLEVKTDETQTQVNQNSDDIQVLQRDTGSSPAPAREPVRTPVAQPAPTDTTAEPTPTPTPEPQPAVDPYTITAVSDTPTTHAHECFYTLYNGKTQNVKTGNGTACYAVGDVLPQWLRPS